MKRERERERERERVNVRNGYNDIGKVLKTKDK